PGQPKDGAELEAAALGTDELLVPSDVEPDQALDRAVAGQHVEDLSGADPDVEHVRPADQGHAGPAAVPVGFGEEATLLLGEGALVDRPHLGDDVVVRGSLDHGREWSHIITASISRRGATRRALASTCSSVICQVC